MGDERERVPKPLVMKPVRIIECIPGHAEKPGEGEKIAIVRTLYRGCIEHPTMLTMIDVKVLACGLIRVLKYHDEDIPQEIIDSLLFTTSEGSSATLPPKERLVNPSIRKQNPSTPITTGEVSEFLHNLNDDDQDILKLLGLPAQRPEPPPRKPPTKNGKTPKPRRKKKP
jgi:hypothetical protein